VGLLRRPTRRTFVDRCRTLAITPRACSASVRPPFAPFAPFLAGTAIVTVQLHDNGGTTSGGVDTSAAQTFAINVTPTSFATATTVTSSNSPSLFGVPITFKATVTAAPGGGVPVGSVTFKDGAATIGSAALTGGVATLTTSTLAVGTHSITAVYAGSGLFNASTSPALSQVISASATLKVVFRVHAMQDGTKAPKVATIPVPNAIVEVFSTSDACTGGILSAVKPKKWGLIFDGADGPGGVDGCTALGRLLPGDWRDRRERERDHHRAAAQLEPEQPVSGHRARDQLRLHQDRDESGSALFAVSGAQRGGRSDGERAAGAHRDLQREDRAGRADRVLRFVSQHRPARVHGLDQRASPATSTACAST